MRLLPRRPREGSYSVLFGLATGVMVGFGALALDVSLLRLSQSEAQDIADAASQGALITLRSTGETSAGEDAASAVLSRNTVLGVHPTLEAIQWGRWDGDEFHPTTVSPNAVKTRVGRDVPMILSRMWGWDTLPVSEEAVSAARPMHVVLVMDITNSWSQSNFAYAREAALAFYDYLDASNGPEDKLGMVVFTGRFGVKHTPLLAMDEHTTAGTRATWTQLRTASKAGTRDASGNCTVYTGAQQNNFSSPLNGCYPSMWREYIDESGTDHTTGIQMAYDMLMAEPDLDQYRAMIILTDGEPNGVGAHTQRGGYVETRWPFWKTPNNRTTAQVITDSVTLADQAWTNGEVHIWAVSFVANATWLGDVAQGDGYYTRTSTAAGIVPIFEDIAESLPVGLVK